MATPPSKKAKFDVEPPTAEELNNLKEAEALYHSAFFRLQVGEMMKTIKLKAKRKRNIVRFLESLKSELRGLQPSECYSVRDESWINSENMKVPIFQEPASDKGNFKFLPPVQLREIGSYILGSLCSKITTVDLAVEIPSGCWQKLDFLNHRYHRKRAMYLSYLAQELQTSSLVKEMKFSFLNGCHMKPVLLLTPEGVCGKHSIIRVIPFPPEDVFKLNRFFPIRNNVRPSWFLGEKNVESDVPTPHYNSSILADILLPNLANFLQEKVSSDNITDGIILLKVWSAQRGFNEGFGGFGGFIISMLVSYLLKTKKINPRMSSYQVFRNTLLFIANHSWFDSGITLCDEQNENQPSVEDFRQFHDVVFLDPSGYLNICANLQKETLSMVCFEAQLGMKLLDSLSDCFTLLFLNKLPFCRKFDYLLHISCKDTLEVVKQLHCSREAILNHGNNIVAYVVPHLCKILTKALGQRIHVFDFERVEPVEWPISKAPPNPKKQELLTFGLLLNTDFAFNPLEKGPITEDPECKNFLAFWGDISEMRRFQDGTICEAVFWKTQTVDDRRMVIGHMIKHILKRHASVDPKNVHLVGTNVHPILKLPRTVLDSANQAYGTGEEAFMNIQNSFSELTKDLRKLKDKGLPLIASIQGVSPSFRFCEVFPPLPATTTGAKFPKNSAWIPSLKVIVTFEGSRKWRDDVKAIRMEKLIYYVKFGELVKSHLYLQSSVSETYVDILKDGYVFRLEVACHKEIFLLKQVITSTGMKKVMETKEACELELSMQILPKLNSILHGLHQQHNSYGAACRIAKRWISSQLLYDFIHEEVVELLVASLYIDSAPFACPSCPQIAFQRFLSLISSHDWRISPLIINLNNEFKKEEISEIHSAFIARRPTLPPMVIAHPLDKSGTLWTRKTPISPVMHRLITLAKSALETLEKQLYESPVSDFKICFRPPLEIYDVIIHLNPLKVPKRHFAVDFPYNVKFPVAKNYEEADILYNVDRDPVQCYLQELRALYDEFALFFYDAFGGNYIALLWKPKAFVPVPPKVSNAYGRMQASTANSDGSISLIPDVETILSDFKHIASKFEPGLFKTLDKRTEKWTIA